MDINKINKKIFRAYDVRGIYGEDIDEDVFYLLGMIFASYISGDKIAVGRDIRPSSLSLSSAFVKGLTDSGVEVLNVGEVTTPILYFATNHLGCDGGAMITASHNPQNYNGIKFVKKNAEPIGGLEIGDFVKSYNQTKKEKSGSEKSEDVSDDYLNLVSKDFNLKRNIKINVTTEKSVAGFFIDSFFKKMGIENYQESSADVAFSFDPDGDRLEVFDEKGKQIRGDIVGGIIANTFLKKGNSLVHDITSTRKIREYFTKKEMSVERSKVGHFFIKNKMRKEGIDFGLEASGHYYFKNLNYVESAFYALRLILEALDKNPDKKISELASVFDGYFNSGEINLPFGSRGDWENILDKTKDK
ncbi:MAG: hypothetical protein K9M15_00345 [Candidatus Marinimicrobia bacterium]|nr:hypothetical protein [Candidatus Neomarinimicrobiota bacterium]